MNPTVVTNKPKGLCTKLSWTHPWSQMNPTGYKNYQELTHGYKIIMNAPMVTNEPTHGYKIIKNSPMVTKLSWTHPWLQMNPMGYKFIKNSPMVTKLSWTHPWLQMNPMGYKIIMNPPMVTNEPNGWVTKNYWRTWKQASTRRNNKFKNHEPYALKT